MSTHKLNGELFKASRDSLAASLKELTEAQKAYGELVNAEAKLQDELDALKANYRATDSAQVSKKTALVQQLAEVRAQSRAIESKSLPRCREALAVSLTNCVNPYRDKLAEQIAADKVRLVRILKDFYKLESRAVEVAEHSDKIAFLLGCMRVEWSHSCADTDTAQRILNRMDDALAGKALIAWPPLTPSPG